MTTRELKKKLIDAGWVFMEGSKHTRAMNPNKPDTIISIPRHTKDLAKGTLDRILKDAGLK